MDSILIVEDDKTIAMGIEYSLKQEGFDTHVCYDAKSAQAVINKRDFILVILDISLPDGNGFELCRAVRAKDDTPVIFLTAYDDEVNVVMGLDMGADDYITKPFRVRELMSRIKSVLRRYNKTNNYNNKINIGSITIDPAQAKVFRKNCEIALTPIEYRLLLTLAHNKGRVLSRNQLLEGIWDVAGDFVNDNTLTVYIKRLREKIEEDPQHPMIIKTVRGLGYKAGD
jgi:DNA-binding response OmpR family regulator